MKKLITNDGNHKKKNITSQLLLLFQIISTNFQLMVHIEEKETAMVVISEDAQGRQSKTYCEVGNSSFTPD